MKEILEDGHFSLANDNGEYTNYSTLFTFYSKKFKKNYLVYTDETLDKEGNMNILTSIYEPYDEELNLIAVDSDEEWEMIDKTIEEFFDSYNRIGDEE